MVLTLQIRPTDFAAAVAAAALLGMHIDYALTHPFESMAKLNANKPAPTDGKEGK